MEKPAQTGGPSAPREPPLQPFARTTDPESPSVDQGSSGAHEHLASAGNYDPAMDTPLFGDDVPSTPPPTPTAAPAPVADWQVDLLRKALDARGLTDQQARQSLIEQHVGRPLTSLRDLTSEEALRVISALGPTTSQPTAASAWDEREDDTWIDRL